MLYQGLAIMRIYLYNIYGWLVVCVFGVFFVFEVVVFVCSHDPHPNQIMLLIFKQIQFLNLDLDSFRFRYF